MSLDVLALEFTDMQLKYSKEISAFLDKASAFGQDRILVYLYKENDHILVGDLTNCKYFKRAGKKRVYSKSSAKGR